MRALAAAELLRVWELAGDRHPIDRALALLHAACPGWEVRQLARLPVGQRDALLLALRRQTIGPQLRGSGQCPLCATRVELSIAIADLLQVMGGETALPDRAVEGPAEEYTLQTADCIVRFRLPDSYDLAAVVGCRDAREGRDELVRRCVVQIVRGGSESSASDLPEDVMKAVGDRMAELDSLAEVQLALKCPQCQHGWLVTLDIGSFFWSEIVAQAKRLLHEVHLLARAYPWSEADILAMSERRRRYYLNLVT